MDDVLENDESVKFFTAFPTLACHQLNRGTSDPPHACQYMSKNPQDFYTTVNSLHRNHLF